MQPDWLGPLDALDHSERTRWTVLRVRADSEPATKLAELAAGPTWLRVLAAQVALALRDGRTLLNLLRDSSAQVRGAAAASVGRGVVDNEALAKVIQAAPDALRSRLVGQVARCRRAEVADRVVEALWDCGARHDVARLLPVCSRAVTRRWLGRTDLPDGALAALAAAHPSAMVGRLGAALAAVPRARLAGVWEAWAPAVSALCRSRPRSIVALLRRFRPERSLPAACVLHVKALVTADEAGMRAVLTGLPWFWGSAGGGLTRVLAIAARRFKLSSLAALILEGGWVHEQAHKVFLALAPWDRARLFHRLRRHLKLGPEHTCVRIVETLPRAAAAVWVRRWLTKHPSWVDRQQHLELLVALPLEATEAVLSAAQHAPEAGYRRRALEVWIRSAAEAGQPDRGLDWLDDHGHDDHLVRQSGWFVVSKLGARHWAPANLDRWETAARLALARRDADDTLRAFIGRMAGCWLEMGSPQSEGLALALLSQAYSVGAFDDFRALRGVTAPATLERIVQALSPALSEADGRRQVRLRAHWARVYSVPDGVGARPAWKRWDAEQEARTFNRLTKASWVQLGLALGRRGQAVPALQTKLRTHIDLSAPWAEAAARLWLLAPETRDVRVRELLAESPALARLGAVVRHVHLRRQSWLDTLFVATAAGIAEDALVPGAGRGFQRWLPRQQEALSARILDFIEREATDLAMAIEQLHRLPRLGLVPVSRWAHLKGHPTEGLATSALTALSRADDSASVLPIMVDATAGPHAGAAADALVPILRNLNGMSSDSDWVDRARQLLAAPRTPLRVQKALWRLLANYGGAQGKAAICARWHQSDAPVALRLAFAHLARRCLHWPGAWSVVERGFQDTELAVAVALCQTRKNDVLSIHQDRYCQALLTGLRHPAEAVRESALRALSWPQDQAWWVEGREAWVASPLLDAMASEGGLDLSLYARVLRAVCQAPEALRIVLARLAEWIQVAKEVLDTGTDTSPIPPLGRVFALVREPLGGCRPLVDGLRTFWSGAAALLAAHPIFAADRQVLLLKGAAPKDDLRGVAIALAECTTVADLCAAARVVIDVDAVCESAWAEAAIALSAEPDARARRLAAAILAAYGPLMSFTQGAETCLQAMRRDADPEVRLIAWSASAE